MISDFFANKRIHRFISCKAGCPLSFGQRWAYSYLVFHARCPTVNGISHALGMKHQTVKAAVAGLVEHGLAEVEAREVRACEPTQDWFARWSKREGSWRECLGYSRVRVMEPGCPLTLAQNTLYWVLVSLAKGRDRAARQSCAGLAAAIGVSRKTIDRALKELLFWQLAFIRQKEKFFDVRLLEPDSDVVSWYVDKPASKRDAAREPASEPESWKRADVQIEEVDGPLEQSENGASEWWIKCANTFTSLTENQRELVAQLIKDGQVLPMWVLVELDDNARAEHARNQRTGKTKNTGHHGKLLWHKILTRLQGSGVDTSKLKDYR